MTRFLITILKFMVTIGLIFLIFRSLSLNKVAEHLLSLHFGAFSLALFMFCIQIVILGYRWRMVIRSQGGNFTIAQAMNITFIAQFFNQALPSSVGGDAVRIFLANQEGAGLKRAFQSVVGDRILATVMLLVLVLLCMPIQIRVMRDASAVVIINLTTFACLAGFALVLIVATRVDKIRFRWNFINEATGFAAFLHSLFLHGRSIFWMMLLSLGNHILSIVGMMLLASALSLNTDWTIYAAIVPLVMLMTLVPLSIGGWGVREAAMSVGFGQVGMPAESAVTLSLLFGAATAVVSLPGGLLWAAKSTVDKRLLHKTPTVYPSGELTQANRSPG